MAIINGTPGDDRGGNGLFGTEGDDTIFGFEGRDELRGEAGNDTLDGGEGGRDRARYDSSPGPVTGNLTTGIVSDGFGGTDTLINIEEIAGSDYNDTLTGAESGVIRLFGRGGDDVLVGNNTSDEGGAILVGGDGDDTLTVIGGQFSFMEPGSGDDTITGSTSFDIISYFFSGYEDPPSTQGVTVTFTDEGVGTVIDYRGDTDTFTGIEQVEGTMFDDTFIGSAGSQSFRGTGGNDTINGGEDDDEVNYDGVRDDFATESGVIVDLEAGTATDKFGDTDTLISIEQVRGSDFADQIKGDGQNNRLRGEEGDDTLEGGAGNDYLEGGLGDDTLDGGSGDDAAGYSGGQVSYTLTLSPTTTTVMDRRADGNGTDTLIDMELLGFDTGDLDLNQFAGTSGLSEQNFESFIELYIAYFNRAPDAVGLNFWGTAFANGTTLEEMATLFIDQDETLAAYPAGTSNSVFAETVFDNVLGRTPDQAGLDFWVGALDGGDVTRDQFILEVLRGAKSDLKPELGQDFVDQQLVDREFLTNKTDIGAYFAVHKGMSDVDNASAAMALYDGTEASIDASVAAIDGYYTDALDPTNGEFLMQVVGVLDDPFAFA